MSVVAQLLLDAAGREQEGDGWVVPTATAFLGAVVAFVGQSFLQRQASSELRKSLLAAVVAEIELIDNEAEGRIASKSRSELAVRRPLPTEAWRAVQSSSVFGGLKTGVRRTIASLYAEVSSANYEAAQAPTYLLIAALTESPQSDAYDELAREVSTTPFEAVRAKTKAALYALEREGIGR